MKFTLTSLLIGLTAAFAQEQDATAAIVNVEEQSHRALPNYYPPQKPSYPSTPNCYEECYEVCEGGGSKGGKKGGGFYYGGYYGGKGGKGGKGGFYYGFCYEECETVCDGGKGGCDPNPTCGGSYISNNCCYPPAPWPTPSPKPGNCYEVCYESGGGKGGKKGGFYYGGGGGYFDGYYGGKGGKKGGSFYYGFEECEIICDGPGGCDPNPTCGGSYISNNCCYPQKQYPTPPMYPPSKPTPGNCYEVCYEVCEGGYYGGKGGKKGGGFYYGGYYGGKGGKGGKGAPQPYCYDECEIVCDGPGGCDPNPTCGASYMSNNCCYPQKHTPMYPPYNPQPPMYPPYSPPVTCQGSGCPGWNPQGPGFGCYEECYGGGSSKGGKKGGFYYGGKGGKGGKGGYYGISFETCEWICPEPACDPSPYCYGYGYTQCCPKPPKKGGGGYYPTY